MIRQRLRFLACLLPATLAILLAAGPARASIWSGSWDPQFGSPFTTAPSDNFPYDLGWAGQVKVNDDACGAGLFVGDRSNAGACAGGAFVVPGTLIVKLYDLANSLVPLATLTLNAATLTIDTLRYDATGKLTGFSTLFESDYVSDTGAGTNADFAVQFVLDGSPSLYPLDFSPLPDYDGPVLFAEQSFAPALATLSAACVNCVDRFRSNVADFPAVINFTPEPAGLALMAAGLLAAGAAARRRRVVRGERQSA